MRFSFTHINSGDTVGAVKLSLEEKKGYVVMEEEGRLGDRYFLAERSEVVKVLEDEDDDKKTIKHIYSPIFRQMLTVRVAIKKRSIGQFGGATKYFSTRELITTDSPHGPLMLRLEDGVPKELHVTEDPIRVIKGTIQLNNHYLDLEDLDFDIDDVDSLRSFILDIEQQSMGVNWEPVSGTREPARSAGLYQALTGKDRPSPPTDPKAPRKDRNVDGSAVTVPFRAYPHLQARQLVKGSPQFEISVGFRKFQDADRMDDVVIDAGEVGPDDRCELRYFAEGLKLERLSDWIPFECDMVRLVQAELLPGVENATFTVFYFKNGQPIGRASTSMKVGLSAPARKKPCRISDKVNDVDLTAIALLKGDSIQWIFSLADGDPTEAETVDIGDPLNFWKGLRDLLLTQEYTGEIAKDEIEGRGEIIYRHFPDTFWDILAEAYKKAATEKRKPAVLFLSNETYIPWELTIVRDHFDTECPRFLGAQTVMGRWINSDYVAFPPPVKTTLERFSVMAADYKKSDNSPLPYAKSEGKGLEKWGASLLKATKAAFRELRDCEKVPGHFLHFALHGVSEANSNFQRVILPDNTEVTPRTLMGIFRCATDKPRFSFVFLNACEVGLAGQELGEVGGFPGAMVYGGVHGFVAPIWEVIDVDAFKGALEFYERILQNGVRVGEALRLWRKEYGCESTTPLAYVFYGHPNLKVEVVNGRING